MNYFLQHIHQLSSCVTITQHISYYIYHFPLQKTKNTIHYLYHNTNITVQNANNQTNNNREKSSFSITNYMSNMSTCNTFGSLATMLNSRFIIFSTKYISTIHIIQIITDFLVWIHIYIYPTGLS